MHGYALGAPEQALGADLLLLALLLVFLRLLLAPLLLPLASAFDVALQKRPDALEHLGHYRLALRRVDVLLPETLERPAQDHRLVRGLVVAPGFLVEVYPRVLGGEPGELQLLVPAPALSLRVLVLPRLRRGLRSEPHASVLEEVRLSREAREVRLVPVEQILGLHVVVLGDLVELLGTLGVVHPDAGNLDRLPGFRIHLLNLLLPRRGFTGVGAGRRLLLASASRRGRVLALGPLLSQQKVNEIRERRVREGLAPAARLGIQRELNLVVALLDPRVGERHLSADRPSRRLLGLLAALLQPSLLRPLDALLGAAYEARLRRVTLTERLEPFALPDNLSLVRQVVLAVGVRARLASEQHAPHRRGFAPAFVARVVRTRPSRRLGEFVLSEADALGVDADGAQVAADDVTAVPAVLARETVAVIATRHLRAAAFLGLGLLLGLAGKHALLALLQRVVVGL